MVAERVAAKMLDGASSVRSLGISLDAIRLGRASVKMIVRDDMLNSRGICHGGLIFALADTAFALASSSYNQETVAQHCTISFMAPARPGEVLTASCHEVARSERNGVYDTEVTGETDRVIAVFRGNAFIKRERIVPEGGG